MTKKFVLASAVFSMLFLISCRKHVQPVITLNGEREMVIPLNGTYVEKGAVAMDNKDDDISEDIIITGSVNTNKAGEYRLFYDVEDSEGNKAATAHRFISVVNDANGMIGSYAVTPSCTGTSTTDYYTSVTISEVDNNKIYIKRLIYMEEDYPVVGIISGTDITIPLQVRNNVTISGTGTMSDGEFIIDADFSIGGYEFSCIINHIKV